MIDFADETLLGEAIRLAMNGRGRVEPNPMVGCVLAKNGVIVGEGYHAKFGGPHAEPTALADCRAREHSPRGATAYVTLEPCCHTNKKTPPCAPRMIDEGIARVVIGATDPNPDVDGRGVAMLRAAGVAVEFAPTRLAQACAQLLAPFHAGLKLGRPYVTLKWAQTRVGTVGGPNRTPLRITGGPADATVQRLRTRSHGIAVAIGTALSDDPRLTVRDTPVVNQPRRYVIDRHLRLPPIARVLRDGPPCRVITQASAAAAVLDKVRALVNAGAEVMTEPDDRFFDSSFVTGEAFAPLFGRHLLVEPGPVLADAWLPWADRLWVFTSSNAAEDNPLAPRAAAVPSHYVETGRVQIGRDRLIEYLNRRSDAFVVVAPSADFVLESEIVGHPGHPTSD